MNSLPLNMLDQCFKKMNISTRRTMSATCRKFSNIITQRNPFYMQPNKGRLCIRKDGKFGLFVTFSRRIEGTKTKRCKAKEVARFVWSLRPKTIVAFVSDKFHYDCLKDIMFVFNKAKEVCIYEDNNLGNSSSNLDIIKYCLNLKMTLYKRNVRDILININAISQLGVSHVGLYPPEPSFRSFSDDDLDLLAQKSKVSPTGLNHFEVSGMTGSISLKKLLEFFKTAKFAGECNLEFGDVFADEESINEFMEITDLSKNRILRSGRFFIGNITLFVNRITMFQ